jgi:mRNA export factor
MSFFGTNTTSTAPAAPAEKDIEVPEPPTDSISSLAFSPAADYLAVGSWDNNVCVFRCYLAYV